MNNFLLILMTFLPLLTALAVVFAQPRGREGAARSIALAGAAATFFISLLFAPAIFAHQGLHLSFPLLPRLHINFTLALDSLSGLLILLTNLLTILSILGSWTAIQKRQKEFYFYLLLLQTGIIGTFLAADLILFYIFWELMLIPLYFLIGIFGSGRRIYATTKFFLFTFAGSVLMLIGILALYHQSAALLGAPGAPAAGTFDLATLLQLAPRLAPATRLWIFLSFLLAFAIKVPLFPLHTWLPDAHTEAPTAGSVMLAGVLLKTGVYGLLRFAIPLFPAEAALAAPAVNALAVIAIIYGALTAFAQSDMKRLVAYSSVSHMGFIVLGVFSFQPQAVSGAALQMFNHGISTGGLFLCVGYLYERRHTRELSAFGGLAHNMKLFAVLTMLMVLSSVGLPGLNGFIGEFLILIGAYQVKAWWAVVAATGVILAACYLLRMMQLTFFGPLSNEENKKLTDLNGREAFTLIVLAALAFWIGLCPNPALRALEPSSRTVVESVRAAAPTIPAPRTLAGVK